ncbi:hypothetical protein B0T17DRAFT_535213 [Bombardia bombarda]|uniref:Uncharacterized protein n=1 Tax=Bombardia bombarda TaxID=252184 RepID=A0AA40C1E5_9PEZI|nr:hypothetical protein B0T17DRAFT_535213 [Bombardia bombarda]
MINTCGFAHQLFPPLTTHTYGSFRDSHMHCQRSTATAVYSYSSCRSPTCLQLHDPLAVC